MMDTAKLTVKLAPRELWRLLAAAERAGSTAPRYAASLILAGLAAEPSNRERPER